MQSQEVNNDKAFVMQCYMKICLHARHMNNDNRFTMGNLKRNSDAIDMDFASSAPKQKQNARHQR